MREPMTAADGWRVLAEGVLDLGCDVCSVLRSRKALSRASGSAAW